MNLLAHALLAGSGTEIRLGNLLADFVKGRDRKTMPPAFLIGVRQHQIVDAFTDLHPIFLRSKSRFRSFPYVGGILVDVFYDHFLSLGWERYSAEPLNRFAQHLYAELRTHRVSLPPHAQTMLDRIIEHDLLCSYRTVQGVKFTLGRIENHLRTRFGREFDLERATDALLANFDALEMDFAAFFPLLGKHASEHLEFATVRSAGRRPWF